MFRIRSAVAVACCLMGGCLCSIIALACPWRSDLDHECSGCGQPVARKLYNGPTMAITPPPCCAGQMRHVTPSVYTPAAQERQ